MNRSVVGALLLAGCAAPEAPPEASISADEIAMLTVRTQLIGTVVRAAAACHAPLTAAVQDQAARLETAVIALQQAAGGDVRRDAFLTTMRPPEAPTARARAVWCARQRPDLGGVERFLTGPEGMAFIERAEAGGR